MSLSVLLSDQLSAAHNHIAEMDEILEKWKERVESLQNENHKLRNDLEYMKDVASEDGGKQDSLEDMVESLQAENKKLRDELHLLKVHFLDF